MSRRDYRWNWLTCFALANLVCWAGVAAAVGLVVGDGVDFGIETLVRREQATVVAKWGQALPGAFRSTPEGYSGSELPVTVALAPSAAQTTPTKSSVSPAIAWSTPSTPPRDQAQATPAAGQGVPTSTTGLGGASAKDWISTPVPEATQVSGPLLLADPEFNTLSLLDAEMSRSAPARPALIRYGEEALNREISALSKNNPDLPFRNVRVDLQRDRVIVTGKVTVLGFQVNAEITGQVRTQGCRPKLEIETVSAAGVMTPKFVSDQVQQMMLEAMAWYPADYPLCLQQIVLEDTQATIYGYRR